MGLSTARRRYKARVRLRTAAENGMRNGARLVRRDATDKTTGGDSRKPATPIETRDFATPCVPDAPSDESAPSKTRKNLQYPEENAKHRLGMAQHVATSLATQGSKRSSSGGPTCRMRSRPTSWRWSSRRAVSSSQAVLPNHGSVLPKRVPSWESVSFTSTADSNGQHSQHGQHLRRWFGHCGQTPQR